MKTILFIGKKDNKYSEIAIEYLKNTSLDVLVCESSRDEPMDIEISWWDGDYILSFLCQWILPVSVLNKASIAALNWHPGSSSYPGVGCVNFALYNNASTFGIVCHHMEEKVDTGMIIDEVLFPVNDNDTVESLTDRCYMNMLASFTRIVNWIEKSTIDESYVHKFSEWKCEPTTRNQLDSLCEITLEMDLDEIKRRNRATYFKRSYLFLKHGNTKLNITL